VSIKLPPLRKRLKCKKKAAPAMSDSPMADGSQTLRASDVLMRMRHRSPCAANFRSVAAGTAAA